MEKSLQYAYRDRRAKKREFRTLWIIRVKAAAMANGITYSRFIQGLKKLHIELDRKILAELAVRAPETFAAIAAKAQGSRGLTRAMTSLKARIEEFTKKLGEESARVRDAKGLADLRNEFLSRKKGCLDSLFEEMKGLPAAEKPEAGELINAFKDHVQETIAALGGGARRRGRRAGPARST